jgi:hypothetical protein
MMLWGQAAAVTHAGGELAPSAQERSPCYNWGNLKIDGRGYRRHFWDSCGRKLNSDPDPPAWVDPITGMWHGPAGYVPIPCGPPVEKLVGAWGTLVDTHKKAAVMLIQAQAAADGDTADYDASAVRRERPECQRHTLMGQCCTLYERLQAVVSRPFPSWNRSILTEIYLCNACSCQEILRTETAGQLPYLQSSPQYIQLQEAKEAAKQLRASMQGVEDCVDALPNHAPDDQPPQPSAVCTCESPPPIKSLCMQLPRHGDPIIVSSMLMADLPLSVVAAAQARPRSAPHGRRTSYSISCGSWSSQKRSALLCPPAAIAPLPASCPRTLVHLPAYLSSPACAPVPACCHRPATCVISYTGAGGDDGIDTNKN